MQIGVKASRAVGSKRVFVVDDDEITRAVLQLMLQDENETHDLPDLDAAFSKARDWPPNLLLLGLSVVRTAPSVLASVAQRLPGAAVLLVTERGEEKAAQVHVGNGAHGVVSKPLTVESVRRRVDAVLGLSQASLIQLQVL